MPAGAARSAPAADSPRVWSRHGGRGDKYPVLLRAEHTGNVAAAMRSPAHLLCGACRVRASCRTNTLSAIELGSGGLVGADQLQPVPVAGAVLRRPPTAFRIPGVCSAGLRMSLSLLRGAPHAPRSRPAPLPSSERR